jgi:cytochrome c biogenesis protein CcdA
MAEPLTALSITRNAWIVAGLLLLAVGIGDVAVARTKLSQYQETLASTPAKAPKNPAVLFPKASEAEEQRSVARAKLGFYNMLFLAGQLLTFGGLVLIVVGVVQVRSRNALAVPIANSR